MDLAITLRRGDDYTGTRRLVLTVTDGDAPVDLTGTELRFMAKRQSIDADDDAVIDKATGSGITLATQADDTLGQALLAISGGDTDDLDAGLYAAELRAIDSIGTVTLATGTLTLLRDVIRG